MGTLFNTELKSKKLTSLYRELELQYHDVETHPLIKQYFFNQIKDEIEEEINKLIKQREEECYEHIFFAPQINNNKGLIDFTCVRCGKKISLSEAELYLRDLKQSSVSPDFLSGFNSKIGRLILNKNSESDKNIEYYRKLYLEVKKVHDNYLWIIEELMLQNYEQDKKDTLILKYRKRDKI